MSPSPSEYVRCSSCGLRWHMFSVSSEGVCVECSDQQARQRQRELNAVRPGWPGYMLTVTRVSKRPADDGGET